MVSEIEPPGRTPDPAGQEGDLIPVSADERPTIQPKPNGPYLVRNLANLSNRNGPIQAASSMALCRCGGSANKPFCDGTHAKNGFSSARKDDRVPDKRDNYEGDAVTIHDNRGICAHAGKCTDGLPAVFRLEQEPWIDPNAAPGDQIVQTIRQCPSGALSHSVQGREHRDGDAKPSVFVSPNGPYVVAGGPELLETQRGEGASEEHYTLCRCGGSRNKPFCDGSHWEVEFRDPDGAGA